MPTSGPPSRLVVDANPILAALLGGQARRVFFETPVREFAVPEIVLSEVREHLPRLATKLSMMPAFLEYTFDPTSAATVSGAGLSYLDDNPHFSDIQVYENTI